MPTISVIVPCYNYARFLPDAIHSLIGGATCLGEFEPQTLQDFDIWIINDASTDDTDLVAQSFISDRIHYIRNEINFGTAATLNVGIRQAGGQFITYLSADDMMESSRLERLYKSALANQHRFIYDDLRVFDGKQRTETWPMSDYDFDKSLYKNMIHSGIFYPKQAWQEIGGYAEIMRDGREDWQVNVALGKVGWCGVHVREPNYLYRRAGQNRSLSNQGGVWRQTFLGKMQSLYPELYRGERPAMCCGNSNKRTASAPSRAAARRGVTTADVLRASQMMVVGSDGMVELEYQLPKAGTIMYTGAVTHQQYAFSMLQKRNRVDSRDAPAFLSRIEDRRHAFVQVVPTPEPARITPPYDQLANVPKPPPPPAELETEEIVITETVAQTGAAPLTKSGRKPRKA